MAKSLVSFFIFIIALQGENTSGKTIWQAKPSDVILDEIFQYLIK